MLLLMLLLMLMLMLLLTPTDAAVYGDRDADAAGDANAFFNHAQTKSWKR